MLDPATLTRLLKSQDIISFILLDPKGAVLAHNVKNPEKASGAVFLSSRHLKAVGKHQFRHALFSLDLDRTLILFALGDRILSVVTDKDPKGLVHVLESLI